MQALENQVVWITGASSGIGRELALTYARTGARLVISARRKERLEELRFEIENAGGSARCAPLDVTDHEAVHKVAASISTVEGGLDIAIANAGFGVTGPFHELTVADWKRQFDVNLFGLISTAQAALPLLEKRAGRLALIGSVAGVLPGPMSSPYGASKAAVRSLVQSLAIETCASGVSITGVYPGYVRSEIFQVDNQGDFQSSALGRAPAHLAWPTDRAARVIVSAIHKRKREYTFTAHAHFAGFLGRHWPWLMHQIMRRAFLRGALWSEAQDKRRAPRPQS